MTKWVDQKSVEMRIIVSDVWQEILDELEKPDGQYTPRHATSILKGIAKEYSWCVCLEHGGHRIQQERDGGVGHPWGWAAP